MRGSTNHSALLISNKGRRDLTAVPRFQTNIQVKGILKPDKSIQIVVNVRANLSTKNASVHLFLPGIHALKQSKPGQPAIIPLGEPLKPEASWKQALSKGQIFSRQKTITVKKPGYYHVIK